jgi:SAM-dependent methyltransferase
VPPKEPTTGVLRHAPHEAGVVRCTSGDDDAELIANSTHGDYPEHVALTIANDGDILTTVDLKDATTARRWAEQSALGKPWRPRFREAFSQVLAKMSPSPRRILELGSGPGLLARRVLQEVAVDEYVLFDFSEPMMEMARETLGERADVTWALGDFKAPNWAQQLRGPFDAVISMQAIHEIRHKRHVPWLYAQVRTLLRPGGVLLVSDAEPTPERPLEIHLLASTQREQEFAMLWAGFSEFQCHKFEHQYYLVSAVNPA